MKYFGNLPDFNISDITPVVLYTANYISIDINPVQLKLCREVACRHSRLEFRG